MLDISQVNVAINVILFSDIITRMSVSYIVSSFSSQKVFLFGILGIGIFRLLILHLNLNYEMIIFLCVCLGFFRALTVINQIIIISDLCKKFCPRKLPGCLGLSYCIKSAFLAIFNYLFQYLDYSGIDLKCHLYLHVFLQLTVVVLWILML